MSVLILVDAGDCCPPTLAAVFFSQLFQQFLGLEHLAQFAVCYSPSATVRVCAPARLTPSDRETLPWLHSQLMAALWPGGLDRQADSSRHDGFLLPSLRQVKIWIAS